MAPAEADKPLCFAIMPITTPEDAVTQYGGDKDHFVHVAEFIFKPAAELAGYQFVPASVDSSRVIQAAIIDNLANADVVLCDTSLWNANVFFELGIRVALNKPVALVRDKLTESIPFDNTPVHCHEYDHRMDPWCLKAEIPKLSEYIKAAGGHEQNELWKFAGIQITAQQSDAGNPEDAKLDLVLAEMGALREQTRHLSQLSQLSKYIARPTDRMNKPIPTLTSDLIRDSNDLNQGGVNRTSLYRTLEMLFDANNTDFSDPGTHDLKVDKTSRSIRITTAHRLEISPAQIQGLEDAVLREFPDVRKLEFIEGETGETYVSRSL